MIVLGSLQKLQVIRNTSIGVFLNHREEKEKEDILLPQKQVPEGIEIGDEIEVFIYRDSKDRLIATTRTPKLTLGQIAKLRVVEVTSIGAFLDWGLERDLLLPFKEQKVRVEKDKEYLVTLYVDKSDRLCATMDLYRVLSTDSPYKEKDKVQGVVYDINSDIGAFVAVDGEYHGLIPKNEFHGEFKCGDEIEARVTKVKEDGKLDLSVRREAYLEINDDAKVIYDKLLSKGGVLNFNDKSSPEAIKDEFKMSKAAFKRAVGRLLKEGIISFEGEGIKLIK